LWDIDYLAAALRIFQEDSKSKYTVLESKETGISYYEMRASAFNAKILARFC